MGSIFYLMGKSASGKDSMFRMLAEDKELGLKTVTMYTTRPRRSGEEDGREYFFRQEAFLLQKQEEGQVIECRTYETVLGPWRYFTLDDGQIDLGRFHYLMMGTLESYENTKKYFESRGRQVLFPVYIEVEDGERLLRAVKREMCEKEPHYKEVCRRFLADSEDFSRERLDRFEIDRVFQNQELLVCKEEIKAVILEKMKESVVY
ncbi:MAG: guanylate kinase [Lachnospiraceae bacterium]|nr:guanylate kinase [Lachnospiraceae bacterium]